MPPLARPPGPIANAARRAAPVAVLVALAAGCGPAVAHGGSPPRPAKAERLAPLSATVGVPAPTPSYLAGTGSSSAPSAPDGPAGERICTLPALAVTVLIDRSGSMKGARLQKAESAALRAVQQLADDDLLEVLVFEATTKRLVGMTSVDKVRATLATTLAPIEASGTADLFVAVDAAYQDLSITAAPHKHILLITDAQTTPSSLRDLATALGGDGITVTVFGLGYVDTLNLETLADYTAGHLQEILDPAKLPDAVAAEAAAIEKASRY